MRVSGSLSLWMQFDAPHAIIHTDHKGIIHSAAIGGITHDNELITRAFWRGVIRIHERIKSSGAMDAEQNMLSKNF